MEMKPKKIADLNELYTNAEGVDKEVFSEMRTNVQLAAGDHYTRAGSRYWNRLRDSRTISPEQKIRLTKNHIGRIARIYQNSILSDGPSVTVSPKQEKEVQHQKAAELHNSVLEHIKHKHNISRKISLWCKDYIEIGEVFTKVFWDPSAGIQVGWEPALDAEGNPIINPLTGQMEQGDTPAMSGDLIFEGVHAFDVLRDPAVKSMDESPYLILRKMESVKELEKKFGGDEAKLKFIKESSEDTFRVFNNNSTTYSKTKGLCMVREYYYKKCAEYPNGYFYITTETGILSEGELPFGIYPVLYLGFDELTTSPRSRSIIKQLRPYQIEINRASSKMAEHQITLGDDKVLVQSGSKPGTGLTQPGVRIVPISGMHPTIIPGRTGDQYLEYIQMQISEMYQIADVAELDKDMNGQLDPYTLLFRSIRQKQKFSFYSEKFGQFIVKVHETALQLFKKYASDHILIPVIGKNEYVNIDEFKNSPDVCWTIKIEPMSDDLETKMGKQLSLNHILQYVGPQLDKKDIGKFLRLSPYLNMEKMFGDMTQDYDNLQNDILALDRGKYPAAKKYDDHEYMTKGLTARMKQPDFEFLPQPVQQAYAAKLNEHEVALAEQQAKIQQAQSGFIPSGGYLVVCDLYVPDPSNPKNSKRVRVPSEALDWLLKKLEIQGSTQLALEQIGNNQAVADIAGMLQPGSAVAGTPQYNQQMR